MAIDLLTFRHLLEINRDYPNIRNVLVLGRQHFLSPNPDERTKRQMTVYQRMLEQFGHDLKIENLVDSDGFCNSLFDFLGFETTDYMDVSEYEGANVIHDMNTHVPANLHGKYDLVIDGGTIEHIFNVPSAFENVNKMLHVGGYFLAFNPCNNWVGHSFYQFGPELVWSYWRSVQGYEVIDCKINAMRDWFSKDAIHIEPPEARDMQRDNDLRHQTLGEGIKLLIYLVKKKSEETQVTSAQQSNYQHTWNETDRHQR